MHTRRLLPTVAVTALVLAVSVCVAAGTTAPAQPPTLPTRYLYAIGGQDGPGRFTAATRVEVAPSGELYLTDGAGVQVLDAGGAFQRMWGGPGHGDGQLNHAAGLGIGTDGRVLVADLANGRVQRFSAEGRFRAEITGYPDPDRPGAERRFHPVDVAIAANGDMYVGDGLDNRVVHFAADGDFVRAWAGPGTEPGSIAVLTALTLAPDGTVWVGDGGLPGRVHAFSRDGTFLRRWDVGGVRDLAATAGVVYVLDGNGTLRTFAPDGTPLGPSATPPEPMPWPPASSVAAGPDGSIFVLCASDAATGPAQLVRTNLERETLSALVSPPPAPGAFDPVALEMDHEDTLFIADAAAGLGQVQVLGPDGTHRATWPDGGGQIDVIRDPAGIARMPLGPVYVSERTLSRVVVLDEQGRATAAWGGAVGTTPGAFGPAGPGDVAASHELSSQPKRVFIADPSNARVVAFDDQGSQVGTFGGAGDANGQFVGAPTHLTTSPQGRLYATDLSATQRVQVFEYTGDFVRLFHGLLGEDARFAPLAGIDYSPGSGVFLADPRQRIQAFSRLGEPLGQWDVHASRPDLSVEPGEVVAGTNGLVYVADRSARRIHVFGPSRPEGWLQQAFANPWLTGAPGITEWIAAPDLDWGSTGSPGPGFPADGFSVRLSRFMALTAGTYVFTVEADGAVRLRVDDHLVIDDWQESTGTTWAGAQLAAGEHYIQLEYADFIGRANVSLHIGPGVPPDTTPTPAPATPSTTPPPATTLPPPSTPTPTVRATADPGACPDRGCAAWLPAALRGHAW